jgi:pimeloyl-ACP methyl ester carboxylesterase
VIDPVSERTLQIAGPDGRKLEVELSGPDEGRPLIFHNGTPMAGRMFAPMVAQGAERGVRHIAYSRPGYCGSERDAGRTVADCARDVAAIADELGIERFLTVGWSGGGPHALACAALLPERTMAAATLAGVAPANAQDLDWLDGMGEENIEEFAAARAGEDQLSSYLQADRTETLDSSAEDLHAALGDLLSDVDGAVLSGEFAEYFAAAMKAALEHGIWGWFDDDLAFFSDWGFDLGAIAVPVTIWQGEQDRFVPFGHGRWLAEHVSGSSAQLPSDQGHLSLAIGSYARVLDDLIAAAG